MPMNVVKWIDQRQHWWKVFVVIFAVSVSVVGYIGYKTYEFAPPMADFKNERGEVVFSADSIIDGQNVFLLKGLMEYGSYLGDGGMKGPDYTGEALHKTAVWMNEYYVRQEGGLDQIEDEREQRLRKHTIEARVQLELKENRYDTETNTVTINDAQVFAFNRLVQYYGEVYGEGGELAGLEAFKPANYITDPEDVKNLTAFCYWGGWLCSAERPGFDYSYTHNWPYDPLAGNVPHGGLVLWSVIGTLVVILFIGVIFYYYGKLDREAILEQQQSQLPPFATADQVDKFKPTPTQQAMYKFFAVAAVLFGIQVLAGLLTIADHVSLFAALGFEFNDWLPVTVTRAWHSQISILWIAVCWFAATIWILPLICRPEPAGQLKWINTLFGMLVFVAVGGAAGISIGISGLLPGENYTRWFGLQGWEFLQIGRLYHIVLFASFMMWLIICVRGLWPALRQKQSWSLPNWMVYSIAGIIFMFTASFVARPDTNFVIADFWRWCTVHMWVEAFFELFTTIIVAYFLYLMGFVSHMVASRVVYLGAVLFLGSGLIGISHNFYWNAKSIESIALGGVFSSLQVAPLVLLTIEAWRFRKLPESTLYQMRKQGSKATFGLGVAFLFLVGVNFWNFLGAGVMGFMLNLPIVNYYQHGTYLTVNHGHAALMGVYGNLAIATMLFCGRWNIGPSLWNPRLLKTVFWSLNIGLALMVVLDLFPVGVHQLIVAMSQDGYAFARSQAYFEGSTFQTFTMLRGVGAAVFVLGGVLPLVWFMVRGLFGLKTAQSREEQFVVPPSVLAFADQPTEELVEA